MNFDTFMNRSHKEVQDGYKKDEQIIPSRSDREILTEMYDDLNRMLSDCDTIHPDSETISPETLHWVKVSETLPLYNNNMYEEEWELYKGITPYEPK